ncbi:hypothetical protein AR158_C678L [Paramecium bursaria Chlorella virus AR158]|uniref:hypothetical protein n=1 Tax=Paramecium bursaria Chlorella virus AR158 TaxID=380598 RepID=UPI00015AA839|nr:hypothetical protein AR158_C678L [Paramecium bursaria Chlorella virus AR158]ABU44223.1 hypothetical protein AR158_C678L [Paramecium bursaria Chlorella virus AR158]
MNAVQQQYYKKLNTNAIESVKQKTMLDECLWTQWFKHKTRNNYEMTAFDAFDLMCRGCYYCGDIALTVDRLDSDEEHTLNNCVGCCSNCNSSKGAIDPKTFVLQAVYRTTFEYPDCDDIWHDQKCKPLLSGYKRNAKKQGKSFDLAKEQFAKLIINACYYCHRMPTTYFGIDKIDPKGGYTMDNCVTACASCNWAKWDQCVEEFIARDKRITDKYLAGDFVDMKLVKKNTSIRRLITGKSIVSGANHPLSKKIYRYNLDGSFIRSYDSVAEAVEDVGGNQGNISSCASGKSKHKHKHKTAYGFKWSYVPPEDFLNVSNIL